jgi:predicted membrane protein
MFCVTFWNSLSFFCFHFLQYISNIFGCCFIIFAYFISVFIWVFSFVCILDRFACYSRDYNRSFVFACFLVFIDSWVIYTYLFESSSFYYDAKLVLFCVSLSSARRWYERCEHVRILRVFEWNTSNVRIFFVTTNQFL